MTNNSYLGSTPLLRYLKDPVLRIEDLYVRYPQGGEPGWFALVMSEKRQAFWCVEGQKWEYLAPDHKTVGALVEELPLKADITEIEGIKKELEVLKADVADTYDRQTVDDKIRKTFVDRTNINIGASGIAVGVGAETTSAGSVVVGNGSRGACANSVVLGNNVKANFLSSLVRPVNGGQLEEWILTEADFDWSVIPFEVSGSDIVFPLIETLPVVPVVHYDYYFMTYLSNPGSYPETNFFAGEGYFSVGAPADFNGKHVGLPKHGVTKISLSYTSRAVSDTTNYTLLMRIHNFDTSRSIRQALFKFRFIM